MNDSTDTCRACGEETLAGTSECPTCGHSTSRHNELRYYFGVIGTLLSLTIVLAPLGLPLVGLAYRHRQLAEGTVTEPPRTGFFTHVRRVINHQMNLEYSIEQPAEFTRSNAGSHYGVRSPPRL